MCSPLRAILPPQEEKALAKTLSQPAKDAVRDAAAAAEDAARQAAEDRRAAEQRDVQSAAAADVCRKLQALAAAVDADALTAQQAAKKAEDLLSAADFGVRKQLNALLLSSAPGLLSAVGLDQARVLCARSPLSRVRMHCLCHVPATSRSSTVLCAGSLSSQGDTEGGRLLKERDEARNCLSDAAVVMFFHPLTATRSSSSSTRSASTLPGRTRGPYSSGSARADDPRNLS